MFGKSRIVTAVVSAVAARLPRALGETASGVLKSVLLSGVTVGDTEVVFYAEDPAVNAAAVPVAAVKVLAADARAALPGQAAVAEPSQVISGYVGAEDATHTPGDLWVVATATLTARIGLLLDN